MTQEERSNIAKLIRRETYCGLMEAAVAVDKLIYALKHGPSIIMDKPRELEVTWKERIASDISDAYQLGRENMKEQMMEIITKDDNLEEAGTQYVKTHFRDIDWTPDVIKSCLEEAFISGGEYVFKKIKYE